MTLPMMRRAAPGLTALLLGLIACVAGSPPRASAADVAPPAPAQCDRQTRAGEHGNRRGGKADLAADQFEHELHGARR